MTKILNGKKLAAKIKENIKKDVEELKSQGISPTICVIEVGDDPASKIYLGLKGKFAKEVGINERALHFPAEITQEELLNEIKKLNQDPAVNGIMVQLPVSKHIDETAIFDTIDPIKDADGFHPFNQGKLWQGNSDIIPATVRGILSLIDEYNIDVAGKNALVIGRSTIVGKPMAAELLNRNATVTIAHSKTKNLSELTKQADIIVSDVGQAHLVTGDMVKDGVIIIDVGMNREDGQLMGDVEYDEVESKSSAITPVPGGVGPLTVASLMEQVIVLTRMQNGR
ncbi:tetrahydrofolate dehydrogenase/cyclohydrolase catalytic domain-containing protein [Lactobacillus sp.]|uniref:bifunctional 5,10-methylenetetrahydrofolate dehydrogenase/5,10-methenyltetrahydrofolate cyclohydrolase n=1 Tax=Lactobacillus sp. TaxID=1591 RepID=UPI0019AA7680|nr:tetrahydrofolate dehydrogenase/cyclohydrolase catalytic domain-containing protein [Lactobacillus sp.]MBD5428959.1 bifunctional methylenetetrahydrofolate dehydrogenase/methenyltetrahydrofolate cyclohydrolase [Lactobacillus sp.]